MADAQPDYDATMRIDDKSLGATLAKGQRVFGHYVLEAEIGRGGMGVVWRALDEALGETIALKFLPATVARDAVALDELKDETRRARRLRHANIVSVFGFEPGEETAAIAMEFIDGTTLAQLRLRQPGKVFSVEKLAPLLPQICGALEYAHTIAKIAHRDLKPANILVTRDGVAKLADFGIARSLTETHTRITGQTCGGASGTLPYMSPEQLLGRKPTAADDIYALGATLYELLTSKPPFHRGEMTSLMLQVREEPPPPLEEKRLELEITGEPIPAAWEETILACLAKQAEDRPASVAAVLAMLELPADAATPTGRVSPPTRRPTARAAAADSGATPPTVSKDSVRSRTRRTKPAPARPAEPEPTPPVRSRSLLRPALIAGGLLLLVAGGWYLARPRPAPPVAAEPAAVKGVTILDVQRAKAEAKQRDYTAVVAKIDALVVGAPPELRQSTETAVKEYLTRAPADLRAEVENKWNAQRAAYDGARLAATAIGWKEERARQAAQPQKSDKLLRELLAPGPASSGTTVVASGQLIQKKRPGLAEIREEQRRIEIAYLGDAAGQLKLARERLAGGKPLAAQEAGFLALEQFGYARVRLERHPAKIEGVAGVLGTTVTDQTKQGLRDSFEKIRASAVELEAQLDSIAASLEKAGLPLLRRTLRKVQGASGDGVGPAVAEGLAAAGVPPKGDGTTGASAVPVPK